MQVFWIFRFWWLATPLLVTAVLSKPTTKAATPETNELGTVTDAVRGEYNDTTIPWCIMGMDCALPDEMAETYQGYYNLIVRNTERVVNYPFYTCEYEDRKAQKKEKLPVGGKYYRYKVTMIYYGPKTTVCNLETPREFTVENYAKGVGVPKKNKTQENPHKVNFEEYGDEFVHVIYSSLWMRTFYMKDQFSIFIMRAPKKIAFEQDDNFEFRVTLQGVVEGPVIKIGVSFESSYTKTVEEAKEKIKYDLEMETTVCGTDRMASFDLGSLAKKKESTWVPIYVWLVPYTSQTIPALLHTVYILHTEQPRGIKTTVEKDSLLVSIDNLPQVQNKPHFMIASDLTTEGTPTLCGSSNPLWYLLDLTSVSLKNNTHTNLKIPLYLSGQKVLICATFGTVTTDVGMYTSFVARTVIDSKLPIGAGNMFNVDATGKVQIVLKHQLHPMSEIMLVETDNVVKHGIDKTNNVIRPKDHGSNRNLSKDEDLMSSLGHVSLDGSAIMRRIDHPGELPLQSMRILTFPPHFSYRLGDNLHWSTKVQFLPQLLYVTDKSYSIVVCDRWRHQHCLSVSDFTDVVGAVLPNRFVHSRMYAKWIADKLHLYIATVPFHPLAPYVKLVKVSEGKNYDYDRLCNMGTYIYATYKESKRFEDKDLYKNASGTAFISYFSHEYEVLNVEEGQRYSVCYTLQDRPASEKGTNKYPSDVTWNFMTMLNPQIVSSNQRTTFWPESNDFRGPLFSTTGILKNLKIRGVYLSEDTNYDCSNIDEVYKQLVDEKPLEIRVEGGQTESTFWLPLNMREARNPTIRTLPAGFWLSAQKQHWAHSPSHLLYLGPLQGKKDIYKACFCYEKRCVAGGEVVKSKNHSTSVTKFIESSGFLRVVLDDKLLCLYGKREIKCFNNKGYPSLTILSPLKMKRTVGKVKFAMFRDDKSLVVVRDDFMWIYNQHLTTATVARVPPNIEYIYSSNEIVIVFLSDGYLYVSQNNGNLRPRDSEVQAEKSVFRLLLSRLQPKAGKISDWLKGLQNNIVSSQQYDKNRESTFLKPSAVNFIKLRKANGKVLKVRVLSAGSYGKYYIFYIDEALQLHYTIGSLGYKNSDYYLDVADPCTVPLNFGMEDALNRSVTIKPIRRTISETKTNTFVFVHLYGSAKMKVFYIKGDEIKPYDDFETNPMIVDFVFYKSRFYGLTKEVSIHGGLSQSLIEIDMERGFRSSIYYDEVPKKMYMEEYYSIEPSFVGFPSVYFSIGNLDILTRHGFRFDETTGRIHGRPTKIGTINLTVEGIGYFSKQSTSLTLTFHCQKGAYMDKNKNQCVKCEKGTYFSEDETNQCFKCEDIMEGSTTQEKGAKSSYRCMCPPGTYYYKKKCNKCPEGTTSESYGSTDCPILQMDKLMVQHTTSVTVSCKKGSYRKGDACVLCPVGFYCFGADMQPMRCSRGMTTQGPGKYSSDDCVCNAGYEWVNGSCSPCNRKSYKESIGNKACTPCSTEEGAASVLYTPTFGATSQRQCMYCKEGFYFDANRTSCVACPVDSFCPGRGTIPLFCPSNTVTQGTNATSINDCLCVKGFGYCSSTRYVMSLDNTCTLCPVNTFQHINGNNMECMPCPQNTYTHSNGAVSMGECLPEPGYYIAGGENFLAEVTQMESLKPVDLQDAVVECISDVVLDDSIAISVLTRSLQKCVEICKNNVYCRFAYYLYSSNSVVHTEPLLSGDSLYNGHTACKLIMTYEKIRIPNLDFTNKKTLNASTNLNNVLCQIKRPKHSLNFKQLAVMKCPPNYYCPGGSKFTKFRCPVNSVTLTAGATRMEHCLCLPGFELSKKASLSACIPCKEGFFKDSTSHARCSACPDRMTTLGKGSISVSQCICSVGYFAAPRGGIDHYSAPPRQIDFDYASAANSSVLTLFLANNFNLSETKNAVNHLNILECKPCPEGYVCPAKWLPNAVFTIHNPPISCPEGSSVPALSHKADSVAKCICKPGYGSGKSYGDELFVSCQKCAPGTFSETYGMSTCSGRCNDYAITFPGASSFKDCFCLPGRFMTLHLIDNEYKFVCNKCAEGTVCPGGFRDPKSPISRSQDPQIAILNHSPQFPRMGYMAIFKRKSIRGRNTVDWKPNDSNSYIIHPPSFSQFGHYDHVSDIHPCVYPNRCNVSGHSACLEGSSGYLCGKCEPGYDTRYFQSICTKCGKRRLEVLRLLVPRIVLLLLVFLACYMNHHASCEGDFSFIVIFKIWYMFVFSLVPLGMQQLITSSSLRHFYTLHHNYFYKPITIFMHTERVGCWEPYVRSFIAFLNSKVLPRSIMDGSQKLDYIKLWYIQRLIAIVKPFIDVLALCLIYIPCHMLYRSFTTLSARSHRNREIEAKMKGLIKLALSMDSDDKKKDEDREMSLKSLDSSKGDESTMSHYLKSRKQGCVFLLHQILLLLTLHFPNVVINSVSMLWCTSVRYKQGPLINVLMHLPDQVCDINNPLFKYGRMIGILNLGFWLGLLVVLFYALSSSTYNPRSWNSLFMSGCDVNCRWWDVVHLSRQFFLACLIVCQYSMDPKGDTEYMRTTCYMILHFVYMALHLTLSPYDDRDNARFYNLECLVFFSNIFMCMFIQGSYLYDFSDLDGLPIVISLMVHIRIIWSILVEYGNVKFANRKRKSKHEFICMVLDFLPFAWEQHHANVYYDYKNDDIVLESTEPRRSQNSLYHNIVIRPLNNIKRILGFGNDAVQDSRSCSYSIHNRDFLISCLRASIEKSNMFKDKLILSNSWCYFIVRYVFWYCHCLHTNIREKNISPNSLFHKAVLLHFFPSNTVLDPALAKFLTGFPLKKLSSHASVQHNGTPCDGKCEIFTSVKKRRRVEAVAESMLVDCLFDTLYDLGPVSLVEFYFGLLSLNQLKSSVVLRLFEAFRIHSLFLTNEKEFQLKRDAGTLNQNISQLKHEIEGKGKSGAAVVKCQTIASQIEEVEGNIKQLKEKINSEKQIIMAGRAAAAAALNLHLGVDNFVNEGITHEEILDAISSLPSSGKIGESILASSDDKNMTPVYKLGH